MSGAATKLENVKYIVKSANTAGHNGYDEDGIVSAARVVSKYQ